MVSGSATRLLDFLFSLFPKKIFWQDFLIIFQLFFRNCFYTSQFNRYLEGYYAEIGGFTYQGRGKTPGARLGLGINFTRYHIDAEKFFRGEYKYVMMTIILVTHTRYYNPRGETIGWTISLFGKGLGLTWFEEGCVKGSSIALQ